MGGDDEARREANYALLQQRWPGVFEEIEAGLDTFAVEAVRDAPEFTLRVDGLHLTSAYNRLAEAQTQAHMVPADAEEAWVYGVGLGDLPRVLLERSALKRLYVVLLSVPVARASFAAVDHTDWLRDPRVELALGEDAFFGQPFAVAPTELKLADGQAMPLRDQVLLELSQEFQAEAFREKRAELLGQVQDNFETLAMDGDVRDLFGSARGLTAVVTGAGPTLDEQLDWIASERDRLALFAVTTALKPLAARDIVPDVVVVVDPKLAVGTHLQGLDLAAYGSVPLVYAPSVHPEIVSAWPGPRLAAYLGGPVYARVREELPRGSLFCSGTVTHAAVDLAVKAGAERVVLAGVDFSYPELRGHAAGAADNDTEHIAHTRLSLTNGRGESVPTDARMIGFLRDLERYIAATRGVKFVKTGRAGAEIAGTEWMEESDAA